MGYRAQVVVNTLNYSLEVYKWLGENSLLSKEEKKLMNVSNRLFDYLTCDLMDYQKNKMIAIGKTYEKYDEEKIDADKIEYILYEGKCGDERNLTYFKINKILKKGLLSMNQINDFIK